jgi:cobalamin-dependent methionine synthase I
MIGARALVLLACTLGLASERELRTKNALNATDALLFNAATSSLVEAGANYASEEIAAFAEQHQLYSGLRFSPGYGDLPLALQSEFAKTLDLKRTLGITVTPENLLIPLKSITAFVGLFDTPPKQSYRSPCKDCPAKQSCTYKERGLRCYD